MDASWAEVIEFPPLRAESSSTCSRDDSACEPAEFSSSCASLESDVYNNPATNKLLSGNSQHHFLLDSRPTSQRRSRTESSTHTKELTLSTGSGVDASDYDTLPPQLCAITALPSLGPSTSASLQASESMNPTITVDESDELLSTSLEEKLLGQQMENRFLKQKVVASSGRRKRQSASRASVSAGSPTNGLEHVPSWIAGKTSRSIDFVSSSDSSDSEEDLDKARTPQQEILKRRNTRKKAPSLVGDRRFPRFLTSQMSSSSLGASHGKSTSNSSNSLYSPNSPGPALQTTAPPSPRRGLTHVVEPQPPSAAVIPVPSELPQFGSGSPTTTTIVGFPTKDKKTSKPSDSLVGEERKMPCSSSSQEEQHMASISSKELDLSACPSTEFSMSTSGLGKALNTLDFNRALDAHRRRREHVATRLRNITEDYEEVSGVTGEDGDASLMFEYALPLREEASEMYMGKGSSGPLGYSGDNQPAARSTAIPTGRPEGDDPLGTTDCVPGGELSLVSEASGSASTQDGQTTVQPVLGLAFARKRTLSPKASPSQPRERHLIRKASPPKSPPVGLNPRATSSRTKGTETVASPPRTGAPQTARPHRQTSASTTAMKERLPKEGLGHSGKSFDWGAVKTPKHQKQHRQAPDDQKNNQSKNELKISGVFGNQSRNGEASGLALPTFQQSPTSVSLSFQGDDEDDFEVRGHRETQHNKRNRSSAGHTTSGGGDGSGGMIDNFVLDEREGSPEFLKGDQHCGQPVTLEGLITGWESGSVTGTCTSVASRLALSECSLSTMCRTPSVATKINKHENRALYPTFAEATAKSDSSSSSNSTSQLIVLNRQLTMAPQDMVPLRDTPAGHSVAKKQPTTSSYTSDEVIIDDLGKLSLCGPQRLPKVLSTNNSGGYVMPSLSQPQHGQRPICMKDNVGPGISFDVDSYRSTTETDMSTLSSVCSHHYTKEALPAVVAEGSTIFNGALFKPASTSSGTMTTTTSRSSLGTMDDGRHRL